LSLRVTANNVCTWTVFYRDKNGRQKRLSLGRYPAGKLVDARELAREAQRKVARGGDPVVEKRAAREVTTFGTLAKEYIDGHAKPNKRSWEEDQRQLDANLLLKWKNRPAAEISAEDLLGILNSSTCRISARLPPYDLSGRGLSSLPV
jgi:Arm DNA-binding domain